MSQLDLAYTAEISPRHLSFVETGRSSPSREMILRLSEQLEIPMRERNVLLVAAGYAPIFPERKLDDPALAPAREAIALLLESHKPYPAFAIDRHWRAVLSNGALPFLYDGVADALRAPPLNVMRLSLHPEGLAPRIANLFEWRSHLLQRLRRDIELTADPELIELQRELLSYPAPRESHIAHNGSAGNSMVVPFRIHTPAGLLSFFSTTMVFGTALDVTLSELAIETFFPADAETTAIIKNLPA